MKKRIALLLAALMLVSVFSGCQTEKEPAQTTEATTTGLTQPPEEQEFLRVLTIGNSHTVDANLMLYDVIRKEMPDQKLLLGNMYFSGCAVSQHVKHFEGNQAVYVYYRNDGGGWQQTPNTTLEYALQEQAWDIIILHEMNSAASVESNYKGDHYQKLIDYVKGKTMYPAKLIWNLSWANPTSEDVISFDWAERYRQDHGALDYVKMFTAMVNLTQEHVTSNKAFSAMIPTGTAFCYARNELGLTDADLYRDSTHLSDTGSFLTAYLWYAVITGKTELSQVNVDKILAQRRFEKNWDKGDMIITQELKDVVIKSVNFALKNPWQVTPEK